MSSSHPIHRTAPGSAVLLPLSLGVIVGVVIATVVKKLRVCEPTGEVDDDGRQELREAWKEMESVLQNIIVRCMADPDEHAEQATRLSEAQKAWVAFLDAHIRAIYPEEAELCATAELRKASIRAELTRERTRQLREWWE